MTPNAESTAAVVPPDGQPDGGGPVETGPRRAALVRFRSPGQTREVLVGPLELKHGLLVVVESERGTQIATVLTLHEATAQTSLHRVLRVVTDEDLEIHNRNKVREREAFAFCGERIRALSLPMKLVGVELAHSGTTAVFSFTSEERVDFRGLVKDLARRFHTRIDMHQVGVRDAARVCGGLGVCGRELCCATCLTSFSPISVRMAKDQNLALNQEKLSGACGRLKCCLAYEEETYAELRKGLPKLGKRVLTPDGEGRVKDVNVIKRLVRVQLGDGAYKEYAGDIVERPPDVVAQQALREQHSPMAPASSPAPVRPVVPAGSGTSADAPESSSQPTAPPVEASRDAAPGAAPPSGSARRRRRRRRKRGGGGPGGALGPGGAQGRAPDTEPHRG
jgi:cell fate regulator YaaT (PSP1 superfamily)